MANEARDRAVAALAHALERVSPPPTVSFRNELERLAEAIVDDIIAATQAPSEHAQAVGRLVKDKRTYGD